MSRRQHHKEQNIVKNNILYDTLDVFKESSFFLLILMTFILVITNILFIVKISISKMHFPLIFCISIITYYLYRKKQLKKTLLSVIIATLFLLLSTFAIGRIYDITADGNTYHKLAVGALKNGWNPLYSSVGDYNLKQGNAFDILKDNVNVKWVDHYARGTETFAAVIYAATGNIECGKVFNILWIYIGIFILFYILRQMKLSEWKSLLIAIVMSVNPIIITHISNYYLDGVLAISLFVIILICCIQVKWEDTDDVKDNYLILAMAVIWCVNTKFTGLVYAAVFAGVLYLYRHIYNYLYKKKTYKRKLINDTIFYIITVVFAVIIVGSNTYTKNFVSHGHPFYPLYGKGHVQNMVRMEIPKSIQNYSHGKLFLLSIFAMGENVSPSYETYINEPELKIPFTITKREISNYNSPDIRMGGFGPWFSGIFIISVIAITYLLISKVKNKEYDKLILLSVLILTSCLLVLLLDGSYWARYIPYIYLLPIYAIIGIENNGNKQIGKYFFVAMIFLCAINSSVILLSQTKYTYTQTMMVEKRLNNYKKYCNKNKLVTIRLYHNGVQGIQYNLDDIQANNYKLVEDQTLKRIGYNFFY